MTKHKLLEKENPVSTIGRRLNSMRHKLMVSLEEVERISDQHAVISYIFADFQNTVAEIEKEMNLVHTKINEYPSLARNMYGIILLLRGPKVNLANISKFREWLEEYSYIVLTIFPLAKKLEEYIEVLSEKVPLALHMYLRQVTDKRFERGITILTILLKEMLNRLAIDLEPIFVLGEEFSTIRLFGLEKSNRYIIQMPLSQYQNVLSWIPLSHEVGHILYHHLEDSIQNDIQPIVIDKVGLVPNRHLILKWFEEFFSDAVMTEFFGIAAIFDLNSLLSFERVLYMYEEQKYSVSVLSEIIDKLEEKAKGLIDEIPIESNIKDDETDNGCNKDNLQKSIHGSHPPPLLRISMMMSYLEARTGRNDLVDIIRKPMKSFLEYYVNESPFPWCDESFRNSISRYILHHIESTKIENNLGNLECIIADILEDNDISKHNIIEIINAINLCYFQQHSSKIGELGDKPERIYEQLLKKFGNR